MDQLTFRLLFVPRESEGSFEFGNYWKEAEDLRAVIQHFNAVSRVTSAILGHSKGVSFGTNFSSQWILVVID